MAELSDEQLSVRPESLARRWLIGLIRSRPFERVGEILTEEFARVAPLLCAQVLRALRSDAELMRLTGRAQEGGDVRPSGEWLAAVSGAGDHAAAIETTEVLRGVVWDSLLEQLREPSTRLVGELADRLAYVCSTLLAAALRASAGGERRAPSVDRGVAAAGGVTREGVPPDPRRATAHGAIIVDEPSQPHGSGERARERRSSSETPPTPRGRRAEIEIRDARRDAGPAAWITAIARQLEHFQHSRVPFAVLLLELVEAERLHRSLRPEALLRLDTGVEQALVAALGGRSSTLTRERFGRYWLVVEGADRAGSGLLLDPLTRTAESSVLGASGIACEVTIGASVCPEDGVEAAALAAFADLELYAQRSVNRASRSRPAPIGEQPA